MVCAPVRSIIPSLKLGDYLSVQAHKPCSISDFSEGIIDRTGAQTMLYLTCTTLTSVDLAHYGVSRAKDWVSVDCGTTVFAIIKVC